MFNQTMIRSNSKVNVLYNQFVEPKHRTEFCSCTNRSNWLKNKKYSSVRKVLDRK